MMVPLRFGCKYKVTNGVWDCSVLRKTNFYLLNNIDFIFKFNG